MRGRIQTPPSLWLSFEITDWQLSGAWGWRVAGVKATSRRVAPLGPERCRASFLVPR